MLRNLTCGLVLAITIALGIPAACCSAADSDIDVRNGALEISTDESHDLILIGVEGNEVVIHILQFDPVEFDDVPSFFQYSEEELIEMADDYRYEDRDLDDINYMLLETEDGNDVVFINDSFELPAVAYLGNGDDYVEGGAGSNYLYGEDGEDTLEGRNGAYNFLAGGPMDDTLRGGDFNDYLYGQGGNDILNGRGGRDTLYGGDDDDLLDGNYDGEIDVMIGGNGADEFRDRYFELNPVTMYVPYYTLEYVDYGRFQLPRYVLRYYVYTIYQAADLEVEDVTDFDANEGDVHDPIEIN